MACFYGGEDTTIREVYETLRAAGLLRGKSLDDKVVLDRSLFERAPVAAAKLAIALTALGVFDRLHIEQDPSTGNITVARDTLDWKLRRLARVAAGDNGYGDDGLWNEWVAAVKAVGGPDAVARWLVANGGAR